MHQLDLEASDMSELVYGRVALAYISVCLAIWGEFRVVHKNETSSGHHLLRCRPKNSM